MLNWTLKLQMLYPNVSLARRCPHANKTSSLQT